jgi:hypothetical protein
MGLFRTSLLVVLSCLSGAVSLVPMAFAQGIDQWEIDSNKHPSLSAIIKNPSDKQLLDMTVYKFEIEHGGCGGNQDWSDCDNDRQRVELTDGYRVSIQSFGSKAKQVKRYYRTNIFIPNEDDFPNTFPMTQMIHQVKLHKKNQPIWMVHYHGEGLKISTDTAPGGACFVNKRYVPRGEWLEVEIFADYTKGKEGSGSDEPFFYYRINGRTVCSLYTPLITERGLKDGGSKKLQLKFGIYNTFPSRWLLSQPENLDWIARNKISFAAYQQDSKGESNGAVSSKLGTPFEFDWPIKLPKQTIYFTNWEIVDSREKLGKPRFELVETKPEAGSASSISEKLKSDAAFAACVMKQGLELGHPATKVERAIERAKQGSPKHIGRVEELISNGVCGQ